MESILSIPDLSEGILLSQWRSAFDRGFHLCPTTAFFSSAICFVNAFLTFWYKSDSVDSDQVGRKVIGLIVAGVFMVGLVPFTLATIVPQEEYLLGKEAKVTKQRRHTEDSKKVINGKIDVSGSEESVRETRAMVRRWIRLNYVRSILPLVGALIAWTIW